MFYNFSKPLWDVIAYMVSNVPLPTPGKDRVLFAIENCLLSVEAPPKEGLPHADVWVHFALYNLKFFFLVVLWIYYVWILFNIWFGVNVDFTCLTVCRFRFNPWCSALMLITWFGSLLQCCLKEEFYSEQISHNLTCVSLYYFNCTFLVLSGLYIVSKIEALVFR